MALPPGRLYFTFAQRVGVWLRNNVSSDVIFSFVFERLTLVLSIALLLLLLVVGLLFWRRNSPEAESKLWQAYADAVQQHDLPMARRRIDQLVALKPDDSSRLYRKAQFENVHGDPVVANQLLVKLVEDKYAKAAALLLDLKFGKQDLGSLSPIESDEFIKLVRLGKSLSPSPEKRKVLELASIFLLETNRAELSLPYLRELAGFEPSAYLTLARVYAKLGRADQVRMSASQARDYFQIQLKSNARNTDTTIGLIESLTLLDLEREAIVIATKAYQETSDTRLQLAGARAMIAWANRLKALPDEGKSLLPRVELIHRATQCAPAAPQIVESLLGLLTELGPRPDAVTVLQNGLARGKDAESIHYCLGMLSLMKADWKNADLHLKLAAKFGSIVPEVASNLVIAYAVRNPNKIERSLQICRKLIELYPDDSAVLAAYKTIRDVSLPEGAVK